MSTLMDKVKGRGVDHEASAPTLALEQVYVAYAAGTRDTAARPAAMVNGANEAFALEDISFVVEAGRQVAVVGPNGAGKSTLFKVIVGTVKPGSGRVHIFGHDPDYHICIAYVPQRSQIDWSFPVTVEDVVMMGRVGQIGLFRWPHRRDWEIVRQCLERVRAGDLAKKQIGELSGGQQQRIFIARALAQGADLLLLDEPFTGLDVPSYEAILEILASLRDDQVTLLVATHDLNLAAERFDAVMLLNRRIIAYDLGAAVLTPENLIQAYGGHLHVLERQEESVLLTDGCCDQGDEG